MQLNHLVPVTQSITNYKLWEIKERKRSAAAAVLSHYSLSSSRREKDEQVNQEAEKVKRKDKNRQREGTFAVWSARRKK